MRKNFILGASDQLVANVAPPQRAPQATAPYKPEEARERLLPRATSTASALRQVPKEALSQGEGVAELTLHPQFLSKSAFPTSLLSEVGLRAVGSKPDRVKPDKVDRKSDPIDEATATIFVAGKLEAFDRLTELLHRPVSRLQAGVREELTSVEDFRAMTPADRIIRDEIDSAQVWQCVLHASASLRDTPILRNFEAYAQRLGFAVDTENELFASGLCFLGLKGDVENVDELAWFSFLRVVRAMPRMRPLIPTSIQRSSSSATVRLPVEAALDENVRVAVFDTPLPDNHSLTPWVTPFHYNVTAFDDPGDALHGLCVTSAALLGPLDNLDGGLPPYKLDHHGVLGNDQTGAEYLAAIKHIQKTVKDGDYRLFNISFGPDYAVADGVIDPFTAALDELLNDGQRLVFVAAGNNGEEDSAARMNRIQPPSDTINGLAIGASDSRFSSWQRATYSAVGPGRLGSRVKPDLMAFGGSPNEKFGCAGPGVNPIRYDVEGTSFASPASMRVAGMLLASMGEQLTTIGLKALLVHACVSGDRERLQVGHGLLNHDLENVLTSEDCEVKVIFQGKLEAGKYARHQIPLPPNMEGMVDMSVTLAYATPVDPDFPFTYAQAGIEPIFRPHSGRFNTVKNPDGTTRTTNTIQSETLFNQQSVYGGADDRHDAHLWDTVLKTRKRKLGRTLDNPCIELHYNRRKSGQLCLGSNQPEIPYSLIFTIRCQGMPNLYDLVRQRYGANLRVLTPRAEVPLRIR